mmetsp:Transcript_42482/g.95510  ORF Transcript_42482/g.95510 Transcript_42482/m.95510 type:complete len:213 (-) Transcript_42482:125-763(-)
MAQVGLSCMRCFSGMTAGRSQHWQARHRAASAVLVACLAYHLAPCRTWLHAFDATKEMPHRHVPSLAENTNLRGMMAAQLVLLQVMLPEGAFAAEFPTSTGGFLPDLLQRIREEAANLRTEEKEIESELDSANGHKNDIFLQARLRNLDAVLKAEEEVLVAEEKDAKLGEAGRLAFLSDVEKLERLEFLEGQLRFGPEENKVLSMLEKLLPK